MYERLENSPRRTLSKSTTKADSCGNENKSCTTISGDSSGGEDTGNGEGDDGGGGEVIFSTRGAGDIVGTGGVGIRGNGVSTGGVIIGIAVSSAVIGMGDAGRLMVFVSLTSYDRYGLECDGKGPILSLITSSTIVRKGHYVQED